MEVLCNRGHVGAALLLALLGCSPSPVLESRPPAKEPSASPSARPPLGPLVAPWIERCFSWSGERWDIRKLALLSPEPPPAGFRPMPATRKGPLSAVKYRSMRAYHHSIDSPTPNEALFGESVTRCFGALLAPDGSFCPSVELPGIDIPRDAADELIAIADEREPKPVVSTCGRMGRLAFLLLDDAERPVAQITLNPYCGRIFTHPHGKPDGGDGTVTGKRRERLRDLLLRLDLADPCELASRQDGRLAQLEQQREQDGKRFGERYPPFVSGVDGSRSMRSLTTRDWKQLCAWHVLLWGHADFGLEDVDADWRVTAQDFNQCIAHPPSCDVAVGEVETCLRELGGRTHASAERPDPSRCKALRPCFWGFTPREKPWRERR